MTMHYQIHNCIHIFVQVILGGVRRTEKNKNIPLISTSIPTTDS